MGRGVWRERLSGRVRSVFPSAAARKSDRVAAGAGPLCCLFGCSPGVPPPFFFFAFREMEALFLLAFFHSLLFLCIKPACYRTYLLCIGIERKIRANNNLAVFAPFYTNEQSEQQTNSKDAINLAQLARALPNNQGRTLI